jgi:hypothetical protein
MGRQTSTGAEAVDSSFSDAKAVTPSDTIGPVERLRNVRGIWADVAGTVSVITHAVAAAAETSGSAPTSAAAVSFTLPAGQVLHLEVAYVLATGTAATGIKALF